MKAFAADRGFPRQVQERIDKLLARMEQQPKSVAW